MLKRLALAAAISASFVMLYARDEVREEFHQTYPLAAAGRVGVHNVNGAIHVSAWDRNEVNVDAIKHGADQKSLDDAKIVVEARADSVEIRTKYPEDCHRCAAIEYTITVPRGAARRSIRPGGPDAADDFRNDAHWRHCGDHDGQPDHDPAIRVYFQWRRRRARH